MDERTARFPLCSTGLCPFGTAALLPLNLNHALLKQGTSTADHLRRLDFFHNFCFSITQTRFFFLGAFIAVLVICFSWCFWRCCWIPRRHTFIPRPPPSAVFNQNLNVDSSTVTLKTQPPSRPLSLPPIPNYPRSLNPFDDSYNGPPQIEEELDEK